jgi:competence protein ComEA
LAEVVLDWIIGGVLGWIWARFSESVRRAGSNRTKTNINTASEEDLSRLGLRSNQVRGIIAYRGQTPFTKIEDIKNVPGIGSKTFDAIKDRTRV